MAVLAFKNGVMNCGKSMRILGEKYNYEVNSLETILAKPKSDKKGGDKVVARIGIERTCDLLLESDNLKELYDKITSETKCILVDEVQFLNKSQVFELFKIAKLKDIPIICYGLKTNFKGELFEGAAALFSYADEYEEISRICSCGKVARFNARKENGVFTLKGENILIDGTDPDVEYLTLCGECYLKYVYGFK